MLVFNLRMNHKLNKFINELICYIFTYRFNANNVDKI